MDDVRDLCLLIDMQANHMAQDPRDIKGGRYAEVNRERCGEVEILHIDRQEFDARSFTLSDHVSKPGRLERYVKLYDLIPMGENGGIWFYRSECAASDAEDREASCLAVPQGAYASITVTDPIDFSAIRAWNIICQWLHERKANIREMSLNGKSAVCLTKFFKEGGAEYMEMYVSVE
ncbi:MAG TPA: hypothetical protein PKE04_17470 [Clostridia bacterium]|nr:hypothetical protein [Clostridia bacterium]